MLTSHREFIKLKQSRFLLLFLLVDARIRIRTNNYGSGRQKLMDPKDTEPENCWPALIYTVPYIPYPTHSHAVSPDIPGCLTKPVEA